MRQGLQNKSSNIPGLLGLQPCLHGFSGSQTCMLLTRTNGMMHCIYMIGPYTCMTKFTLQIMCASRLPLVMQTCVVLCIALQVSKLTRSVELQTCVTPSFQPICASGHTARAKRQDSPVLACELLDLSGRHLRRGRHLVSCMPSPRVYSLLLRLSPSNLHRIKLLVKTKSYWSPIRVHRASN